MIADLTFWQEFGPFIIAVIAGFTVSGALVFIGNRAGAAYEKSMVERAEHFRGLSRKLKKSRRASYEQAVQGLRDKAAGARKVQTIGLYGGAVFLSYLLARLVVGEGGVLGMGKWAIVAAVMLAAIGIVVFLERRGTRVLRARLVEESALDAEPEEATKP